MSQNTSLTGPNASIMGKRALVGAGIAYILITLFLFVPGVTASPDWPKFWMIRPLLIVPFAGAVGGICYHFIDGYFNKNSTGKIIAIILSVVVYIIGMWMGTVLGLDGTLWD